MYATIVSTNCVFSKIGIYGAASMPMEAPNLLRNFKRMLRAAELPDFRFHDLRHTAATLLPQQGVHPKVVQERLGHSTISLTLDTYSHVISPLDGGLAAVVEKIIERGWPGDEVVQ